MRTSFPCMFSHCKWPPAAAEVLKGDVLKRVNGFVETVDFSTIKATVRRLLFGAQRCPPCRQWVKQLTPVYEQMKKNGISLEIVFCSSDRSQEAFDHFVEQMPWSAFTYDSARTLALTRVYNISGIPSLILLDQAGITEGRLYLKTQPDDTFLGNSAPSMN